MAAALGVAAMAVGMAPAARMIEDEPRRPKPEKKKAAAKPIASWRSAQPPSGSIAKGNRHGGAHKNSREIERRRRQAERHQ
jgi:hypothetical protein